MRKATTIYITDKPLFVKYISSSYIHIITVGKQYMPGHSLTMRVVGRSPNAEEWRVSGRSMTAEREGGLSMPSLPRVTGLSAIGADRRYKSISVKQKKSKILMRGGLSEAK